MVWFYELSVAHSGVSNTPPVLLNQAFDADGYFDFSVLGEGDGNYTVQTSTDLTSWTGLLTTNSVAGRIDFADTTTAIGLFRFYRVKRDP